MLGSWVGRKVTGSSLSDPVSSTISCPVSYNYFRKLLHIHMPDNLFGHTYKY